MERCDRLYADVEVLPYEDTVRMYYRMHYGRSADVRAVARDILIVNCVRLVIHLAKSYIQNEITNQDHDDIISQGCLGAIKAVDNWNPKKGRISTLASLCIRQEIYKLTRTGRGAVIIKSSVGNSVWNVKGFLRDHPDATDTQLSESLDISLKRAQEYRKLVPLLSQSRPDYTVVLESLICEEDTSTRDRMTEKLVLKMIGELNSRERKILTSHYLEGQTLQEIGKSCGGVSRERIRQLKERALRRVRDKLKEAGYSTLFEESL